MKITPELLKRYHENLCDESEVKLVENWLNSAEDEPSDLSKAQLNNMEQAIWKNLDVPTQTKTVPLYRQAMRYAAAAIILLTLGFFGYQIANNSLGDKTSQSIALKTITTKRGEKRTITLSDGSTIRMNYETEIRVPEKFEGNQRIVYLAGHAHFDVARDTERPFIIYSEDTKTQVLGTSFDINTKEEETEIIVTSGKVAFSEKAHEDNLVTLSVNDRAVLDTNQNITTNEIDAHALTAWKENQLVFNGQTLAEIIAVLEPWYDVKITVTDTRLLGDQYKFSKENPSLERVLTQLGFAGGFEYKISDKQVSIFKP